jgi:hypothetical protein
MPQPVLGVDTEPDALRDAMRDILRDQGVFNLNDERHPTIIWSWDGESWSQLRLRQWSAVRRRAPALASRTESPVSKNISGRKAATETNNLRGDNGRDH